MGDRETRWKDARICKTDLLTILVLAVLLFSLLPGFQGQARHRSGLTIHQRSVKIHLNLLVPKWDPQTRAQLDCNNCPLDVGGGFTWQNRLLVPLVLRLALAPFGQPDYFSAWSSAVLLSITFAVIAFALTALLSNIKDSARPQGARIVPLASSGFVAVGSLLLLVALMALMILGRPRSLVLPGDFLEIGLFSVVLAAVMQDRFRRLLWLTLILSFVRESSLFVAPIYLLLRWSGGDLRVSTVESLRNSGSLVVLRRAMLLFAIAAGAVILTRALMLGGLSYALGIGLVEGDYSAAIADNLLRLGRRAPSTWLFLVLTVGTSIGIVLFRGRSIDSTTFRLGCACVLVAIVSVMFGHFQETRVFSPLIPITLNVLLTAQPRSF